MKGPSTGAWILIALGTILVLFFLLSRSTAVEAAYPVEHAKLFAERSLAARFRGLMHAAAAEAENDRLKRENASLALLRADIDRLEAENARLRRTLGYTARNPETWIAAGVLSSRGGAAGARETLRVDKGSLSGIKNGAIVTVPNGLVGRVTAVTPHTCEVTLIYDPSMRVACELETGDANPPRGILSGGSDEILILRHLIRGENVPPRSRVVTSGLGGVFPRGLEVGTYLSDGEVMPSVDFSKLEDVFIRREK